MKKLIILAIILIPCFILVANMLEVRFISKAVAKTDEPKLVLLAKDNPEVGCAVYVYRYYTGFGYCEFAVVSRQYHGGVAITLLK